MTDYKYKKGDISLNGKGEVLGYITKTEKDRDTKNKYSIEKLDGTVIALTEKQIIETDHHKDKNK